MFSSLCLSLIQMASAVNAPPPPPDHVQKLLLNNLIVQLKHSTQSSQIAKNNLHCKTPLFYQWNDNELRLFSEKKQAHPLQEIMYTDLLEGKKIDFSLVHQSLKKEINNKVFHAKKPKKFKKYLPWIVGGVLAGSAVLLIQQQHSKNPSSNKNRARKH